MNAISLPPRAERFRAPARTLAVAATLVLVAGLLTATPARPAPAAGVPGEDDRLQAAIPPPAVRPGFPLVGGGVPFSVAPTIADLDFDGFPEIIAIDDNGRFRVAGRNGDPFGGFTVDIGGVPSGPPAVGDVDNDGFLEIVTVSKNGRVRIFSNEGALEGFPIAFLPATPVGGPVLTEIDRSGTLAIAVATVNGQLHVFLPGGGYAPGFPVSGGAEARSPAFAYMGPDNFPRVGFLGGSPSRARIFFTYAQPDTQASIDPGFQFGPAAAVAGARAVFGLNDADHVYLMGRQGGLRRLTPDPANNTTSVTALAGLPNDSVLVQPALLDVTGDLVPELGVLALRGDTLGVWLLDGESGLPLAGFPRRYLQGAAVGGIVCADVGDNNFAEMIFTHSGDKVSCVRSNGTSAWILAGLPSIAPPALGDLDNDGGIDLAVATTAGNLHVYTLGNAGLGPRTLEWANTAGSARRDGRHQIRDRAVVRPFWPPPITPENTFTTRPVIGDFSGDGRPDVTWSDYATGKTFGFNVVGGALPGMPQVYGRGSVLDAPAIGDVTGDGIFESVQGTSQGYLVWGGANGTTGFLLVDNNRILGPPSLADLDNDGNLDVVVGSSSGRLYAVRLTPPVGILPGFPVTTAGAVSLAPALGDVNGDGQTDIVVVGGPRTIHAYPRTGGAALTGWPRAFTSGHTLFQPILVPVAGQTGLRVAFARATAQDSVVAHLVGANGAPLPGWPRRMTNAFDRVSGPVAGDFDNDGAVDLVYATGGDSVLVFNAVGARTFARVYPTKGNLEVCGLVDLDVDLRPEIVVVSDLSTILGIRFNGLLVRSFTRILITLEPDAPPVFGDVGNDGVLDMAASDLGQPILYSWGYGSWSDAASPWPMKGHDRKRTHAFAGPTVVGVDDPLAGGPGAGPARALALPNPSRGGVAFSHTRALAGDYEAAVYDVRGRLVRSLGRGTAPASGERVTRTWDGRDESGAAVPAGIYFYVLRDGAGLLREKVVRLR
jgi:hypothetical protein